MEFAFTALNAQGAKVTDRIQAEDTDQAVTRLQANGYIVLDLAEKIGAAAGKVKGEGGKGFLKLGKSKKIKLESGGCVVPRTFHHDRNGRADCRSHRIIGAPRGSSRGQRDSPNP